MLKWRRKGARERFLRDRLAELQAEREVLQTEITGIERTLRAYLNDVICQIKEDHGYGWSPSPVLGFRMWKLSPAGFHGYREHWKSPELMAECPTTGDGTDVPHIDGKCGSPPCGIYAAKRVEDLLIEHRPWDLMESAVGLVAMTGKVVEHERGYRGEYVAVLAIALPRGPRSPDHRGLRRDRAPLPGRRPLYRLAPGVRAFEHRPVPAGNRGIDHPRNERAEEEKVPMDIGKPERIIEVPTKAPAPSEPLPAQVPEPSREPAPTGK